LPAFFELFLVLVHLLRRGALVVVAEQADERRREVLRVIDRRHRLLRSEFLFGLHDSAAPALHDGIEAFQATAREKSVASARASAEDADFAAEVRLRAQELHRPFQIAQHLIVRDSARRADFGAYVLGRSVAVAKIEVGRDRHVAMVREPARALPIPLVPTRRVVDDDHPRKRAGTQRLGEVGIDRVALGALHVDGLRRHAFVLIGLVHS
jgi:hypothetical protein